MSWCGCRRPTPSRSATCAPTRRWQPAEPLDQLRWWHHGSSISHCIEATTPRGVWPVAAADQLDLDVTNLGFAANAHLDPFTARAMKDSDADLFSLKIGINIVGGDTMKRRTFVPAVHGFLDTIRDGAPTAPILVISPICARCTKTHRARPSRTPRPVSGAERRARRRTSSNRPSTLRSVREILQRVARRARLRTPPSSTSTGGTFRRGRPRRAARRAPSQSRRISSDRRPVRGLVGRLRVDLPGAM